MAVATDMQRFMNNAMARLPGATIGNIQQELFNTLDEFFKGSNCWTEDIEVNIPGMDPANTVYYLTPATPSTIDKLAWAFQKPDEPSIGRGPQVAAAMTTPGEVTLRLQPSSDITIVFTVVLTVQDPIQRDGYVTFPAWVLAKHREAILNGLLGRMYSLPAKPWTNAQLGVFYMRKFKGNTAAARVEWTRNNVYRTQAWAFPAGGSMGSQRGNTGWGGPV